MGFAMGFASGFLAALATICLLMAAYRAGQNGASK